MESTIFNNDIYLSEEQKHAKALQAQKDKHSQELQEIRRLAEEDKQREIQAMYWSFFYFVFLLAAISGLYWLINRHDNRVMTTLGDITSRLRV